MVLLIGQEALDFTSPAVMPDNSIKPDFGLKSYLNGRQGLLVFYPMNFGYVDPTEITAIQDVLPELTERNVAPVAVSVDTYMSHIAWKERPLEEGGIGNVQFPLVSDISKVVGTNYDVLVNQSISLRATFLIDADFFVRYQSVQDLPLGRNMNEIIRVIDSLATYQRTGEVIPANWQSGQESMRPDKLGLNTYLSKKYRNAA